MSLPILCRIIFSAHSYVFSDHVHQDRTPEITVSAMSCNARDDPGFVFATSGRAVSINYCSLVRESHILIVYVSIMFLFCLVCLKRQQGRSPQMNKQTKRALGRLTEKNNRIVGKLNSTLFSLSLLTPPIFKLKRSFTVINLVPSQDR